MVRILCEGKTDKKFILGILSHLGIEDRGGDFEMAVKIISLIFKNIR
jgi:hypothetical protein